MEVSVRSTIPRAVVLSSLIVLTAPTAAGALNRRPNTGHVAADSSLPRMPPGNLKGNQVRPYRVLAADIGNVVHGDAGDALLAGSGSSGTLSPPRSDRLSNFGRLRWTSWSETGGTATGAMWINSCSPTCAGGTYRRIKASIQMSRLNSAELFTRMTVHAGRYTGSLAARRQSNLWFWQ
jgi:hypothetical protein